MRSVWKSLRVLFARSQTIRCPRYLVLTTGPREMNSMVLDISRTNQVYSGRELEMARPSSTWMGMMRKRGPPEGGRGMEECGGVCQRPTKTAWSASHRDRPNDARVEERSLYHSWEDCLRPYSATSKRRTVDESGSGYSGICFTNMSYGRRAWRKAVLTSKDMISRSCWFAKARRVRTLASLMMGAYV